MLTGFEPPSPDSPEEQLPDTNQDNTPDEAYVNKILHPDMKMELAVSDFNKKVRIAKLLLYQERGNKKEATQVMQSTPVKRKTHKKQNSGQFALLKPRPDDFWIKDIPPSPKDGGQDSSDNKVENIESIPVINVEGVCKTESSTDDPGVEIESESKNTPVRVENESEKVKEKENVEVVTASKTGTESVQESENKTFVTMLEMSIPGDEKRVQNAAVITSDDNTQNSSDLKMADSSNTTDKVENKTSQSKEVGIWQHYDKEDIPWCPGTVKRATQEMEEKSTTVKDSSEQSVVVEKVRRMSVSSLGSAGGSPKGSREILTTDASSPSGRVENTEEKPGFDSITKKFNELGGEKIEAMSENQSTEVI